MPLSIRRRIQVLSLSAVCALSGTAAFGQDSPAVTASKQGGISATGAGATATVNNGGLTAGSGGSKVSSDGKGGISATGGGVSASTDGNGGVRVQVGNGKSGKSSSDRAAAARSRNSQFLRSRVEVLQKVGALRRWQASSSSGDSRQAEAIRKQNEKLRKLQQEQIKRAKERRKQQQESQ